MTTVAARAGFPAGEWPLARLLAPFVALHAAMAAFDLQNPARFFNADRADERLASLERLADTWQRGGDVVALLAGRGIVGDWLPHAVLYLAGGASLVILAQVLLALLSIACVRNIGLRLGLDEARASAAAVLYGVLPHTLVYPHQLASEALFVPLVVLSFAAANTARRGLAMGAAILVRPVAALWPFVLKGLRLADWRYFGLALVPLLLWMSFVKVEAGELGTGRTHADLGSNLYQRAVRMTGGDPAAGKMTPVEYLQFIAAHPREAAAHHGRDLATLAFKSGVERVLLDYLDLFPADRAELQHADSGWRRRLEHDGSAATLRRLFADAPALTLVSLAGALAFGALMLLALRGAFAPAADTKLRLALAAFVVYVFVTAQAVDAASSRHRAPAEFALCLLAVLALARREKAKHGR